MHVQPLPSPAQIAGSTLDQSHSTALLRPAEAASAGNPRGSLKGALALLALVLLALLLWQLFSQYRHTQNDLHRQSLAASAQLADHLSLSMALKAEQAGNILQPYVNAPTPSALPSVLHAVRDRLPNLQQLAWLDDSGRVVADSLVGSPDRQSIDELLQLSQGRSYFFSNTADNNQIYLLLRQPDDRGYWLLRLAPRYYQQLSEHLNGTSHLLWLLENSRSGTVLERHGAVPPPSEPLQSVMLAFIDNSAWQLRGLFDAEQARADLLPP